MTNKLQQDLLRFVTAIAHAKPDAPHSGENVADWIGTAAGLLQQANQGHTIRDAINEVVARYGHYASGIYIVETALAEMTVGKGGSVSVRPANAIGHMPVTQSEGFQKARANDDKALASFVQRQ